MIIRHQEWKEEDNYIKLYLHQPYWGAAFKYGWSRRVEGIGVSLEAIVEAEKLGKSIKVQMSKYGTYIITPRKAWDTSHDFKFKTRDNKYLLIIPRDEFTKISS